MIETLKDKPTYLLVVDDDPAIRLLVTESLVAHGFIVEQAETGEQALALVAQQMPDIILLDINMPGINGIETCRQIRQLYTSALHIPILMMTGLDDLDSIQQSYQAGASDFITKPVNWPVLAHHVRYMVRASNASRQAQEHAQETRLAAEVFANSSDAIVITKTDGVIINVNHQFTVITGYQANEVIGQNMSLLQSQQQSTAFYQEMWRQIKKTGKWQGEIWNKRKNNEIFPEWLRISSIKDQHNNNSHYIGSFFDLTQQKAQEKKIDNLAFYDPLTGLANRQLLTDRIKQSISHAKRGQFNCALLLIDLDRFKTINDSLGHKVGDFVLTQVADRLTQFSRDVDTIARYTSDEFVWLLTGLSFDAEQYRKDVEIAAKNVLAKISEPLLYETHEINNFCSIGIAFYSDNISAEQLFKQANIAMHAAKDKGRNRYELFHASLEDKEIRRFTVQSELQKAIERDEFELYIQPQVNIESQRIVGGECLLRWHNSHLGWVSPADFIPIAEETGFIIELGDWVLDKAFQYLKNWESTRFLQRFDCQYIAINVSAIQFAQADFADKLIARITHHQLTDLSQIELELTEGCLMHRSSDAIYTLQQLQALGIRISIDDFGTGYSNLSYLNSFPLDTLKIDQMFIRNGLDDPGNIAIVRAIIAMAKGLNLHTIAEGVETEEELALLRAEDCQIFQGYLCSKPVPLKEWEALLESNNNKINKLNLKV
ncbi:MAG: EAL domain-containing protein [Methylococcaceae bacterium]|nr:EAL domain-containing protein [Methylococcaceae bacterium]